MRVIAIACVLAATGCTCTGEVGALDGRVVGLDARACAAPGSARIGWPCACDTDCESGALLCQPEAFAGYPGGTCTAFCVTDADCGPGSACLPTPVPVMGIVGNCQPSCTTSADCAPARSCSSADGRPICFPLCQRDDECRSGHCDRYTATCTDGTERTGLAIFERCVRDDECRSQACAIDGTCVNPCSMARAGCPDDLICTSGGPEEDLGLCAPACSTIEDCAAFPEAVCDDAAFPVGLGICRHSTQDRSDPCVSGNHTAATAAKVGCNGEPRGGDVPDNQFGGRCTESPDSCAAPSFCDDGICYLACEADEWVNTSSCPSGSRCWAFLGAGRCFPDCRADSDCASGYCDEFNSCS